MYVYICIYIYVCVFFWLEIRWTSKESNMFEYLKWEIKTYEDDNHNIQWLGRNADIMMCYNLEITKNHMSCSLRWAVAKEKTMEFSTGYYCSQQKNTK